MLVNKEKQKEKSSKDEKGSYEFDRSLKLDWFICTITKVIRVDNRGLDKSTIRFKWSWYNTKSTELKVRF